MKSHIGVGVWKTGLNEPSSCGKTEMDETVVMAFCCNDSRANQSPSTNDNQDRRGSSISCDIQSACYKSGVGQGCVNNGVTFSQHGNGVLT